MIQRIILLILVLSAFPCFGALENVKPKNWFCVYHKQRLFSVLKTTSDLVVVDPDAYKAFEINFLQKTKKHVLAYLSIGEAEEYRDYYKKPEVKELIINENPIWTGNFPVKYWEEKWFDIVSSYSDEILAKGFDGFYLDITDAWESYEDTDKYKERMIIFLERLAKRWRKRYPKMVLLFQNSHRLYEDKRILANYNGIVQEGLFASWAEEKIDKAWQKDKIKELLKIKKAGKFVGILEYTRKRLQMKEISEKAAKLGFLPCYSTRDLDKVFPEF